MIKNSGVNSVPAWLKWAREIQALAQTRDHYALNDFQRVHYARLHEIAAGMIDEGSNLSADRVSIEFRSQGGYATPKVDVRAAIFLGDKILLVRELTDNRWTMPGGWADIGESPRESVEREVFEETGLRVRAEKIVGIYDANRSYEVPMTLFHAWKIVFTCEILSGEITSSNETSEARFFTCDEIPGELSSKRTELRHIEDAFSANRDLGFLPVFD